MVHNPSLNKDMGNLGGGVGSKKVTFNYYFQGQAFVLVKELPIPPPTPEHRDLRVPERTQSFCLEVTGRTFEGDEI